MLNSSILRAFDCLAEINGMEDVLYELSKALLHQDPRVELSSFLKHCRHFSRAVFLKKALLKKLESVAVPMAPTINSNAVPNLAASLGSFHLE